MIRPDPNGGFPELEREPIALDEMPDRATPLELARAYGTIAVSWHRLWPQVVDALNWLHGAWIAVDAKYERIHEELREIHEELRKRNTPSMRPRMPSLSSFGPESTIGGGVRFEAPAWEALQRQVAELEDQVEDAQRQKIASEAEARGAQSAISALNSASDRRQRKVLFWISVAGAAGTAIGFIVQHFLHL